MNPFTFQYSLTEDKKGKDIGQCKTFAHDYTLISSNLYKNI